VNRSVTDNYEIFSLVWVAKMKREAYLNRPTEEYLFGIGGIGLALFGVGAPYVWRDMSTYFTYPMVLVGTALILWSFFHGVRWHTSIAKLFRTSTNVAASIDKDEYISMGEAATVLYEQGRIADSVWTYAAERLGSRTLNGNSSAEEILKYMATYIAGKIQLYGVRPPSRLVEEITFDKKSGTFTHDCSGYCVWPSTSPTYAEIKVKKKDVNALADNIKNGLTTNTLI